MTRTRPAGSQAGLTLVEMLVAMVILGFVLTLVSHAVHQVSLLFRAAEATTRVITGGWAGGWTLQPTLVNLVVPTEKAAEAFNGRPDSIDGYTTMPPSGGTAGVAPFRLELRRDSRDGSTEVWSAAPTGRDAMAPAATAAPVARLEGDYEFAYADATGKLGPVWPPVTTGASETLDEALPTAITLRRRDTGQVAMWYPFQGERTRPRPESSPFWTLQ